MCFMTYCSCMVGIEYPQHPMQTATYISSTWRLVVGDYCEDRISLQVLIEVLACPNYTNIFTLGLAVSTFNIIDGATGKGNCTVVLDRYTAKTVGHASTINVVPFLTPTSTEHALLTRIFVSEENAASCSKANTVTLSSRSMRPTYC